MQNKLGNKANLCGDQRRNNMTKISTMDIGGQKQKSKNKRYF